MMGLFMVLLTSWLVAGLIMNVLTRLLPKTPLQDVTYIANESDYAKGYLAGITNVKMYYYTIGEIPSTNWLDKVKHTILNSREKLEATVENVPIKS